MTSQYTDSLQKTTVHLLIQEYLPLEVRAEVLDLGADVLLHHSVQRDPELVQLGFQRGQLCSLLKKQTETTTNKTHRLIISTNIQRSELSVFFVLPIHLFKKGKT